ERTNSLITYFTITNHLAFVFLSFLPQPVKSEYCVIVAYGCLLLNVRPTVAGSDYSRLKQSVDRISRPVLPVMQGTKARCNLRRKLCLGEVRTEKREGISSRTEGRA
ncbi:hypothetical protein, partial [Candidatus Magnetobacterium casense]|uniref:hypothetical protein n=1 Tax=Candidatus Magnetobacterium casense TaxID=1455061 RepID=UPI001C483E47